jgi:hypothetical protein
MDKQILTSNLAELELRLIALSLCKPSVPLSNPEHKKLRDWLLPEVEEYWAGVNHGLPVLPEIFAELLSLMPSPCSTYLIFSLQLAKDRLSHLSLERQQSLLSLIKSPDMREKLIRGFGNCPIPRS